MAIVNEVVTKFAFEGSLSPLTNFNASLGGSVKLLAGATAAFATATAALAGFVTSVSAAADPMIQLSRNTGVAVESIQALGFAATTNGSSVEAMESSISSLSTKIGEAAQKGSEDFQRLGISVRGASGQVKNADQVMSDLNKRFNQMNLSLAERQNFAEKLGIDRSLVQMLSLTTKEYGKLQQRMAQRVISKKEADALAKYNDQLQDNANLMTSLSRFLAVEFAPIFGEMVSGFTAMVERNLPAIREGFKSFAAAMKVAFGFIERTLLPVLGVLGAAFVALKFKAIAAWAAAFAPVTLVAAGIAAVLIVVDDLIVAFQGGKSVIRDFFQEFFNIDIKVVFDDMVKFASDAVDGVVAIFNAGFDLVSKIVENAGKAMFLLITGDFDGLIEHMTAVFTEFVDMFIGGFKEAGKFISDLVPEVPSFSDIGDSVGGFLGFGGGDGASNNNVAQDVTINISTDQPAAAGEAVRGGLNDQLQDAQRQFGARIR